MGSFSRPHICQCLRRASLVRRDSTFVIFGDRRKTGREFFDEVLSLSYNLLELGIRAGDVVAVAAYNSVYYLELLLAVTFVGGILAPLNYRWSGSEARYAISAVRPVVLVTDESCDRWYSVLEDSPMPSLRWHLSLGSSNPKSLNRLNVSFLDLLERRAVMSTTTSYAWPPNGAAIICFTSGTTGWPKGVSISHSAFIIQSMAKIAICGYGEDDVYLHTAPLCHIGGLSSALAMLMVGARHVFIPKFDPGLAVDAIEKHSVTSLITVPTFITDMSSFLREKESWKGAESIRKVLNGGGSLSLKSTTEAIRLFPSARILSAYGMTEACSSLTFMTLHHSSRSNQPISVREQQGTCIGKPAPHVEMRTDAADSVSSGRILTRGPHMMIGYWDQPLESDTGGASWFDTGDVGSIDESGNVWLIGRANGRIKSGGENVYPEEVETAVLQHPGVVGVVVVGVPDATLGETVIGCVRMSSDWTWSESDKLLQVRIGMAKEHVLTSSVLRQFCRGRDLTGFKIPKAFLNWGSRPFPTTSTGKMRRDAVRAEVISRQQSLFSKM
ncbi:hypothetical protein MLD38_027640 [Melastoma candidum]|uniref:Uncharacterized protein n=1 Tax=Melastoma candidum TaxID=119954 RepID=A0ACB9P851_9MYRT|nr:hypothetical protein MLD38_027640 [Melastoma candidum]